MMSTEELIKEMTKCIGKIRKEDNLGGLLKMVAAKNYNALVESGDIITGRCEMDGFYYRKGIV